MPWQADHKEETRARIVAVAADSFRQHGIDGIGIADLMRRAGLTHGAFYTYFASKEALVAEMQRRVTESRRARVASAVAERPQQEKLMAFTELYLSSRHREHPESGCMIASLGGELTRAEGEARRRFDANIRAWLDQLADYAPAAAPEARRRQATGAYAAMIGGMILARGVEDPHIADRILADIRDFLRAALGADAPAPKRSAARKAKAPDAGRP
jgi:TetR/AcrR family transcriptional regulator, transcriptional repressor for nem operon